MFPDWTYSLLISYSKESDTNAALEDLLVQIQNSLLRLNTFMAVGEKPLTIDAWLSFCKVNLIEECLSLLKQVCRLHY